VNLFGKSEAIACFCLGAQISPLAGGLGHSVVLDPTVLPYGI